MSKVRFSFSGIGDHSQVGFHAPSDFYIILIFNLLIMSVPHEGYSKNTSCFISTFFPLLVFLCLHLIKSVAFCSTLNSSYNKYCVIWTCWNKCLYVLINFNWRSFSLLVKLIDVFCLDLNFIVHPCIWF